jgi:hypothetical protein
MEISDVSDFSVTQLFWYFATCPTVHIGSLYASFNSVEVSDAEPEPPAASSFSFQWPRRMHTFWNFALLKPQDKSRSRIMWPSRGRSRSKNYKLHNTG